MSTSAQIRSAWATAVWAHATVTAITDKALAYDGAEALKGLGKLTDLFYEGQVNAFQYLVTRTAKLDVLGGTSSTVAQYEYEVEVQYLLARDQSATNQNYTAVIDRLETIDGLVRSQLGRTWSSTVDYYEADSIERPSLVTLVGKEVWQASLTYRAFRQVS